MSEAPEEGKRFGVGFSIDWNSPLVDIGFGVELPFWLLMANDQFNVTVDGATVPVMVDNSGVEIQHGHQFTRTHLNTVFIGSQVALQKATFPAHALPGGGLLRGTKTLLYLEASAHADAVEAFFGPNGPRFQDGYRYMASLAVGNLRVVNALINAYRRAAVDPFANEVTAWDLPVWFVFAPPRTKSVCCYSHLVEDWFPTKKKWGEEGPGRPIFATSPADVAKQLSTAEIPGEIDLLDGWSLFHRGRFADSTRSFVTSVEVLLESQITRLLNAQGMSAADIDARLGTTRTNFEKRMHDYCSLSKRRVPGPRLHPVPYVSGIRLLDEMSNTRRFRHQIVHHGHRLDQKYEKLMQRAAETTTWLFDWLSDGGDFEERRSVNSTLFFSFRTTQPIFDCEIKEGKIVVAKLGFGPEQDVSDFEGMLLGKVIYSEGLYFRTLGPSKHQGKSIEHFCQMSLFELGLGELEDSAYAAEDGPTVERFFFNPGGCRVGVYFLDIKEQVEERHIVELSDVLDSGGKASTPIRAILVVNDQNGIDWRVRLPLRSQQNDFAKTKGISILTTHELARLVVGTMRLKWSKERIAKNILECDPGKLKPPASLFVGNAYKFWPKPSVLGVSPVSSECSVKVGDLIAIELKDQYASAVVLESKVDGMGRVTLKIDKGDARIPENAKVYLLDKERSFQPQNDNVTESTVNSGAVASEFVDPSRVS